MSPKLADGLAIVDKNRTHLDRLLLEIDLPAVVLPELMDILLTGTILSARWIETVRDSIYQRLAAAVETEKGRQLPQYDLILAYGLRFSDRPKAQQVRQIFHSFFSDFFFSCSIVLQATRRPTWSQQQSGMPMDGS